MGLVCFQQGGGGDICSGQILGLIKITTRISPPGDITSPPAVQLTYKPNIDPRRKPQAYNPKKKASGIWAQEESLGHRPEPTSHQTSLTQIHYSTGAARLFRTSTISTRILSYQYEDPSWSHPRFQQSLLLL